MDNQGIMKVAVVEAVRKALVREVPRPRPENGEVLIKLSHCLLCTWEQRIFSGEAKMNLPFIPGHEVSGTIEEVPPGTVTSFKAGDKVVVKTLDSCGHCEACYRGDDNLCSGKPRKRFYGDIPGSGGLAQFITLPVNRIYLLPNQEADLRIAAFAEPLACCLHSLEHAPIEFGEDIVVVGAGIMGQLHVCLAAKRGGRVLVVEPDKKRADLALKAGASHVINPIASDAVQEILKLTCGEGAHAVFLTTPQTALAREYLGALKKRGRLVYYGSFHPDGDISINPNVIHYSEKVITGSYSPTSKTFWIASRLLSYGIIDVQPYLSETYPLMDVQTAFERSQDKSIFRVCVDLWE
jgi:L-iditol 2-dehydrogenase